MTEQPVIEMKNITKAFGSFYANKNINLDVKAGEIHALLGENGAGKSTMMNMLTGLLQPTSGDIFIRGEKVTIPDPSAATHLGIGMVHQHFMLVDAFTVTENIILGNETTKMGRLNLKDAAKTISELSTRYQLQVDPNALVSDISVGQQQRVEILKTLYRGADIVIFDEPTAVLTPQEIQELISIMKAMAAEGKAVILITHKLDEIKAAADRVTVIRAGESIETFNVAGVSSQELADKMVGRKVSFTTVKEPAKPGAVILDVDHITVKDSRGVPMVDDLSLQIHEGEILGVAGVDGNGQTELVQALTGLTHTDAGKITLKGDDITNRPPRKITEKGLAHIPEDRLRFGLQVNLTLAENLAMQTYYQRPHSKHGVLDYKAINEHARDLIETFDVRTSSELINAGSLSGGNQQKAVIARELDRNASLVIAAQPTRGLDVGAIEYIHKALINERDARKAVLLVSFELDEILDVSDRIAVINQGKIIGVVDAQTTTKQELGLLMTGMSLETARKELAGGQG